MSGKICQFLTETCRNKVCQQLLVAVVAIGLSSGYVFAQNTQGETMEEAPLNAALISDAPLSQQVEDLKQSALELNRDLLILEEELLFPANTQITVFLSVDVGRYFKLDSVKLSIDDAMVASHLYTPRQIDALSRGGIQRLYIGNIKTGTHEVTAIFNGIGPDDREYKRGATITLEKDDDPKMLELRIKDSTASMQPEFDFKEWQL